MPLFGPISADVRQKADYRKYMGHIRTIWGSKDPAKIETHHIYELHRANAERWRQANYLVQVMVVLMNHARLVGYIKKEQGNPAKGIPLLKQPGDGWEPWPDDVRAEFEKVATPRARLVYELGPGTGQRIGDVLKMRWNHIRDGEWDFTQGIFGDRRKEGIDGYYRQRGSSRSVSHGCWGDAEGQSRDGAPGRAQVRDPWAAQECDHRTLSIRL